MSIKVNGSRLWINLMEMAKIGATPKNGSSRLALSPVDSDGRRKFIADCEAIGMTLKSDAIGNLFLRYPKFKHDTDPVVMGSHLDTQPLGGRFDGVYGVLAGLEVVRTIHDNKLVPEKPVEIAVWTNEEGSRFSPSMMGSCVYTGEMSLDEAMDRKDVKGRSVRECLAEEGWAGDSPLGRAFDSYFEAHIEQGPVLEDAGLEIGAVTGGQAFRWLNAYIGGKAAHAGSTPMSLRKDAFMAMSEFALKAEQAVAPYLPDVKLTIGEVFIEAPSRNVIPGEIKFSLDVRYPDDAVVAEVEQVLHKVMDEVVAKRGVKGRIEPLFESPFAPFHPDCIDLVESSTKELGYPYMRLVSGAGHDACLMSQHCPTAMIFIPCLDGISHNECESIEPEHAEKGANVLLHAVLKRAGVK